MAELVWTGESERWLRDIFEYIALDNPETANAVIPRNLHCQASRPTLRASEPNR